MSESAELLTAVREIRDLIQVMAEPALAERDQKLRAELQRIVGSSTGKAKAILLMNGQRTQTEIHRASGMNQGNLSTLVKQLKASKLLTNDPNPTLTVIIPSNFFEA